MPTRRIMFQMLAGSLVMLAGCSASDGAPKKTAQVEISRWSWGFSYSGDYCEGRGFVRNLGNEPLGNVRFEIRLLDKAEKTVATGPGRMEKRMLEPGEASPFSFFLPCPVASSAAELTATHGLGAPVAVRMRS